MRSPSAGETRPPEFIQKFAAGEINWSTGKITAAGYSGAAQKKAGQAVQNEALSAARQKAIHNLGQLVGSLNLAGGQTVSAKMETAPEIDEKIREMVRTAPIVLQNFLSDGAARVVIEFSIYGGGFAQLVLPADIRHIEAIQPVNVISGQPDGAGSEGATGNQQTGGLVLDARGLGVVPALMFTVLDENSKAVYGSAYISREYAVQWGMAAYIRSIPTGDELARITPAPLVIKGLRAVGAGKTDIVISNADASRLKGAVENLMQLRQGRVAVVLD